MIIDNYISRRAVILLSFLIPFSFSQGKELVVELKNGDRITGSLIEKADSTFKINTEFGELIISTKDVI